jgi:hypothetical protein
VMVCGMLSIRSPVRTDAPERPMTQNDLEQKLNSK